MALANSDSGGHLVFGVDDQSFEPVGLTDDIQLDTTRVYNAISKYTQANISFVCATHQVTPPGLSQERRIGVIYVSRYKGIAAIPSCDATFDDARTGKPETLFRRGDLIVRRGAQSTRADQGALDRVAARLPATPEEPKDRSLTVSIPPSSEIGERFVGRQRELVGLWEWFGDPVQRRWLLAGDGGKGKTAIAYEFANLVAAAAPDGYKYVLWLSAKKRRFRAGSIVDIARPDFTDLPTLLDAILEAYGHESAEQTVEKKRALAMDLLDRLPALIVADDIDSLDASSADAVEFLTYAVARRSKVLFTSRNIPQWLYPVSTYVDGLQGPDATKFVKTRLTLFRLPEERFTNALIRDLLEVTTGSPLYVEDLLRLCHFLPVQEAIAAWKTHKGEAARDYAVGREFEALSPAGKRVVLACCLAEEPMSFPEIRAAVGMPDNDLHDAMQEIQGLFLLSAPRLIAGVERFDLNMNTRDVVLRVFKGSDDLRRIGDAIAALARQSAPDTQVRNQIGAAVRQAAAQERLDQFPEAEQTIKTALTRFPGNADLHGQLGILYSLWSPTRHITDARLHFELAAQGNCSRPTVYTRWVLMEIDERAWTKALYAVEKGQNLAGDSDELRFHHAYATYRLGEEHLRALHPEIGKQHLIRAARELWGVIDHTSGLNDEGERRWHSRAFQTLIRVSEVSGDLVTVQADFARWLKTRPDDRVFLDRTRDWLQQKYSQRIQLPKTS